MDLQLTALLASGFAFGVNAGHPPQRRRRHHVSPSSSSARQTLAARTIEPADIQPGQQVLKPSAGTGVLCEAITQRNRERIFAVEVNHRLCELLSLTVSRAERVQIDRRRAAHFSATSVA